MPLTPTPPIALLLLALPFAATAGAQWSSDPATNVSLADGASDQTQPKLVPTADGGVYLSWLDGIGSGYDVRVQKVDAAGIERFAHNGILVADRGFSSTQDYGMDVAADGSALLAFRDDGGVGVQISAARVTSDGTLAWAVPLTSTSAFVAAPKITGTSDGGVVVAWTQDSSVRLQKLDALGAPQWAADVILTPAAGSFSVSDLHAAGTDAILSFIHQTGGFGSPRRIMAQKFDAGGNVAWGVSHVAVFDAGSLQFGNFPSFVPDQTGGAVFSWYDTTTFQLQCFAQRILGNGTEAFAHNGVAVSTDATRVRVSPSAAFDPATNATFVFWREQNSSQSQSGVYGQKLDAGGNRQWTDTGAVVVPVGPVETGLVSTLTSDTGGAFVFWDESPSFGQDRLFAARLDASGATDIAPLPVSSTPSSKSRLALARSTAGHAVLAWKDERVDSGDVLAQNVGADGSLGLTPVGTTYCFGVTCPCANDDAAAGCANSTGSGALLAASGSDSVSANDFTLVATGAPGGVPGVFFYGSMAPSNPFGDGFRCVGGAVFRLNPALQSSAAGAVSRPVDLTAPPSAGGLITSGSSWNFQFWYRDPAGPCGSGFNLTTAVAVPFQP